MIKERAYAKLNLTLGVLYKRTDGYHALDSLMASVSLFDDITLEESRGVDVVTEGMQLPYGNTMRKAASLYHEMTGRGALIRCKKRIPAEAGMGGGSTDGAAVLRGMNRMYHALSADELYETALKVGADVPFCLHGGLCRCEGVGEILTPSPCPELHFAVVKPEKGVSTAALYRSLALPRPRAETLRTMELLAEGRIREAAGYFMNALEAPALPLVPEIGEIEEKLLSLGALSARMTGSGSAVFGLFETREQAEAAVCRLGGDYPFAAYCHTVAAQTPEQRL